MTTLHRVQSRGVLKAVLTHPHWKEKAVQAQLAVAVARVCGQRLSWVRTLASGYPLFSVQRRPITCMLPGLKVTGTHADCWKGRALTAEAGHGDATGYPSHCGSSLQSQGEHPTVMENGLVPSGLSILTDVRHTEN